MFGQATGDYRSAVNNGKWNTPASWQRFNGTSWVAAGVSPTSMDGVITIRSGFNIVHDTGTTPIAIDQVVVASGATLTVGSGYRFNIVDNVSTPVDFSIVGTLQINNGTIGLQGSSVTQVSGTINNAGTVTGGTTARLRFLSTGVYDMQNTTPGTIPLATWDDGSICRVTAASITIAPVGVIGLNGQSFYDLIWNTPSVDNSLIISPIGTVSFTVRHDFSILDTGGSQLYFSDGFDVAINVGNDFTIGTTAKVGFAVDGEAVVDVGNNLVINSNAAGGLVTGGSFGGGNVEINAANVSFGSGSVFDASGVDGGESFSGTGITTFNITGNYSSAGTFRRTGAAASLEMHFTGTGVHSFTSTTVPTFPVNFFVDDTGNLDIAATSRLAGPGTFTLDPDARVTLRSTAAGGAYRTSVAQGNVQVIGTRTIGGTVVYGGTALQRISPETPTNVPTIINNAAHVRMTGNIAFTNTLDLNAGNLQIRNFTLTVSDVAQHNGRFQVQNTSNLIINGSGVFANVAANNPTGQLMLVGTQIGGLTINRTGGGLVTKTGTLTIVSLLDIQNGTLALANTTTAVNGNFAAAATGNITGTGGILTFQGVGTMPALPTGANISGTLATLTMNRTGALNLTNGSNLDVTRLNVYAGTISNTGFLRMANAGTIYRTNGSLTTAIGAAGIYNVQYLNFTAPTITTGFEIPATGTALNNVTINNTLTATPPYSVQLDKAVVARGTVRAQNGQLVTDDFDVTVGVDFQIDATGLLVPGWSTLHFNGSGNQRYRDLASHNYAIRAFDISKTGGTFNVNQPVQVYDFFAVNSVTAVTVGTNAVPRLTLLSSDTLTAHVPTVPTGATISGRAIVQRFLPNARNSRQYRYISVPTLPNQSTVADLQAELPISGTFSDPSTGVFNGVTINSTNPSLFRWLENTGAYQNYPQTGLASASTFERGRGYSVFGRTTSTIMYDFRAALNVGTYTRAITRTGAVADNIEGYNLIGNPYACPIDWDAVFADPLNTGLLNGGIYFIDNNYAYGNTGQVAYAGGVSNPPGFDGVIASGQGFFAIAAASGNITFRETHKFAGDARFIRKGEVPNVIHMALNKGTDVDYATVRLVDDATENFDGKYDAYKFGASGLYISTHSNTLADELAINAISRAVCSSSIPVGISGGTTGNYTLTFTGLESLDSDVTPVLFDKVDNKTIDISSTSTYNFSVTNATSLKTRFELRFSGPPLTLDQQVTGETVCVGNTSAIVTLNTSQAGVQYVALVNGVSMSTAVTGNGGEIQIPVNVESFTQGATEITISAQRASCDALTLTQKATINVLKKPSVTNVKGGQVCGNGTTTLTATAVDGNLYNWYDAIDDLNPIEGQHGAEFVTPSINKTKTYFVAAVNASGCEGERVEVKATVLELTAASITMDGTTLTSNYESGNQWYVDGVAVDGANGKSFEVQKSGVYTVVVNTGTCTTTSEAREVNILGTENNDNFIRIYPNPSPDKVFVEVRYPGEAGVDLITTTGVEVRTTTLSGNDNLKTATFDITSLPDGMYLIKVRAGANIITKKILKAK